MTYDLYKLQLYFYMVYTVKHTTTRNFLNMQK